MAIVVEVATGGTDVHGSASWLGGVSSQGIGVPIRTDLTTGELFVSRGF